MKIAIMRDDSVGLVEVVVVVVMITRDDDDDILFIFSPIFPNRPRSDSRNGLWVYGI